MSSSRAPQRQARCDVLWRQIPIRTGIRHPAFVAARVWCLVLWFDLVTFAVPFSLGVLEGGRAVAFHAFGFAALPGLTFGIVTRLAQLFWAAFGLVNYALMITHIEPHARPYRFGSLLPQREAEASRSVPAR